MPEPKIILEKTCEVFGVTLNELRGRRRFQRITYARHAVAWALMLRGLSTTEIAELLHRDRSTISTSIQRATELVLSDPVFAARWRALQAALAPTPAEPLRRSAPRRMSQEADATLCLWRVANRCAWARSLAV